mmetsp:Transcript_47876/g.124271  ORF Transcript_47876/g.124271 Transcript_47876/m.124271 type:complete len:205 (-) Transcript_47876:2850-3464(-)
MLLCPLLVDRSITTGSVWAKLADLGCVYFCSCLASFAMSTVWRWMVSSSSAFLLRSSSTSPVRSVSRIRSTCASLRSAPSASSSCLTFSYASSLLFFSVACIARKNFIAAVALFLSSSSFFVSASSSSSLLVYPSSWVDSWLCLRISSFSLSCIRASSSFILFISLSYPTLMPCSLSLFFFVLSSSLFKPSTSAFSSSALPLSR